MTPEGPQGSVTMFALLALAALAVSGLIGGLLRHIWAQSEQRTIRKKWQERERLLESRRSVAAPSHEVFEWRPRSASTRDVGQAKTVARVLYIVPVISLSYLRFCVRTLPQRNPRG